nr:hypothetical protein [Edaphobacter modestus]
MSAAAPVLAQRLQQLRAQGDVPVATALALLDVKHHAFAVDIGHLQATQLGPANSGRIQRHDHGAMHPVAGGVDQSRHFLLTEYRRQALVMLRERNRVGQVGSPECLDE